MTLLRQASHSVLLAIALLAMTVRALVPDGYMFAPHEKPGGIDVILCSAQGQTHVSIDPETGDVLTSALDPSGSDDPDGPQQSQINGACVFAAAAAVAAPVPSPGLPTRLAFPISDRRLSESVAPGRGLAAPPPWATGPPIAL